MHCGLPNVVGRLLSILFKSKRQWDAQRSSWPRWRWGEALGQNMVGKCYK
jgi:hypothetical protein